MPLGEATFSAYSLFSSLRNKIDEYFALCQTLLLDRRVGEQMLAGSSHLEEVDFADPSAVQSLLVRAPLAPPQPDGVLDFGSRINPHYAVQLEDLRMRVLLPLLEGAAEKELTKEQWGRVKECFSPHENWIDSTRQSGFESSPDCPVAPYCGSISWNGSLIGSPRDLLSCSA